MFTEPLTEFFRTADFAVAATVNGVLAVNGILDEDYVDPLGISASAPAFTCAVESWPSPLPGNTLAIGARTWTVLTVEPDGTGIQVLRLRKVT
jgi:hypothetical protein